MVKLHPIFLSNAKTLSRLPLLLEDLDRSKGQERDDVVDQT